MAELKTKPSDAGVLTYLDGLEDEQRKRDAFAVLDLMRGITGEEPKLWGSGMVGFGTYHYRYASGHEGDYFVTGFAPRKGNLTLYLMSGLDSHTVLLNKLGRYRTGKSCLYLKRLADVDTEVLKELIEDSVQKVRQLWG